MTNRGRFRTPNPEIRRTSTVLFETMAELEELTAAAVRGDDDISLYGTMGTPTTAALANLLLAREGGAGLILAPSGLSAITTALLAVVNSGDHLLVTDAAYGPVRDFCSGLLTRLGVAVEYYDPLAGASIADLIRPTTRAIWMESPGSHTFEIQDVPAIVAAAGAADHRVVTMFDNTWGSPGLFAPFEHGVDIVVVALTKYWGGHSDLLMGAVFAGARDIQAVRSAAVQLGVCSNADEAYLCLRGARTVDVRLRVHEASALELARRLANHPRVGRVLHPALPDCPGHDTWRRDFRGSNGLFAFELLDAVGSPAGPGEASAFTDRLAGGGRFAIGYSWGGFESLVMPTHRGGMTRDVRPWEGGAIVRLSIGLDPVEELWADLERALDDATAG